MENIEDEYTIEMEFEVLTQETIEEELFLENVIGDFEQVMDNLCEANAMQKILQYCNDNFSIYSFIKDVEIKTTEQIGEFKKAKLTHKITIFEVYDRETNKSSYHFLANEKLAGSFLLALINRREILDSRK